MVILLICTVGFVYYLNDIYTDLDDTSEEIIATSVIDPIIQGDIVKQSFICNSDTVEGISLYFGTYARQNDSDIIVSLKLDNKLIENWTINTGKLIDNSYQDFLLKRKIENARGNKYIIELTSNAITENNAITVYKNDGIEQKDLTLNGRTIENAKMCFRIIYNKLDSTLVLRYSLILITLGIIFCAILINRRRQSVEKSVFIFICNFKYIFHHSITAL